MHISRKAKYAKNLEERIDTSNYINNNISNIKRRNWRYHLLGNMLPSKDARRAGEGVIEAQLELLVFMDEIACLIACQL